MRHLTALYIPTSTHHILGKPCDGNLWWCSTSSDKRLWIISILNWCRDFVPKQNLVSGCSLWQLRWKVLVFAVVVHVMLGHSFGPYVEDVCKFSCWSSQAVFIYVLDSSESQSAALGESMCWSAVFDSLGPLCLESMGPQGSHDKRRVYHSS